MSNPRYRVVRSYQPYGGYLYAVQQKIREDMAWEEVRGLERFTSKRAAVSLAKRLRNIRPDGYVVVWEDEE